MLCRPLAARPAADGRSRARTAQAHHLAPGTNALEPARRLTTRRARECCDESTGDDRRQERRKAGREKERGPTHRSASLEGSLSPRRDRDAHLSSARSAGSSRVEVVHRRSRPSRASRAARPTCRTGTARSALQVEIGADTVAGPPARLAGSGGKRGREGRRVGREEGKKVGLGRRPWRRACGRAAGRADDALQ